MEPRHIAPDTYDLYEHVDELHGPMTDEVWQALAERVDRRQIEGRARLNAWICRPIVNPRPKALNPSHNLADALFT
jgi:hypothetical protein